MGLLTAVSFRTCYITRTHLVTAALVTTAVFAIEAMLQMDE